MIVDDSWPMSFASTVEEMPRSIIRDAKACLIEWNETPFRSGVAPENRLEPDRDRVTLDNLGRLRQRVRHSGRDTKRAPGRGSSVENIVERHERGIAKPVELDPMSTKKRDPFKRTAGRLLSVPQRLAAVHRAK